jgi:hypothetical protein
MHIKKPVVKTDLDEAIDEALRELRSYDAHSEEYAQVVDQLTKLHAMRDPKKSDRVSKDTLAIVLGNLAGIIVIVGYEQKHVVASKALSFLRLK